MNRLISLLLMTFTLAVAPLAHAQTLTTLFNFDATHGKEPLGNLALSADGSTLYGMTSHGGTNGIANGGVGYGTMFSVPVSGGTPTVLFNFDSTHGKNPWGSLTLSRDGLTLYGMTLYGGSSGYGTIFSAPVSGGTPTVLFNFDSIYGSYPSGSLTLSPDGSTLYGMSEMGGTSGNGTIFSVPVGGGTPTVLFSFDVTHGQYPMGGLTLSADASRLYGMTEYGGNGYGTIFSEPIGGGTPTVLFNFDGSHGANPWGNLTLSGSTLYGMALNGGSKGYGTIFSEPVSGGIPTLLFLFDGTAHGRNGYGGLTLSADGSSLYGMVNSGGSNGSSYGGYGTIFSEPVEGGTPTVLFDFDGLQGGRPYGDLMLIGSNLYGMTSGQFTGGNGNIFALTVPEPSTFALLGVAAIAIAWFRWLHRARSGHSG